MYVCMYVRMYVCMINECVYVCMCVCMYVCVCLYVCMSDTYLLITYIFKINCEDDCIDGTACNLIYCYICTRLHGVTSQKTFLTFCSLYDLSQLPAQALTVHCTLRILHTPWRCYGSVENRLLWVPWDSREVSCNLNIDRCHH
jgi:hypothetical protein